MCAVHTLSVFRAASTSVANDEGPWTAIVAHSSRFVSMALATALERTSRFSVVGFAGDGSEASALVELHRPDVAILSDAMHLFTPQVVEHLRELSPTTAIIVSSDLSDRGFLDAITDHVSAVISSDEPTTVFVTAAWAALTRGARSPDAR